MLKDEYIVYLCMYLNISCICKNNTTTHLKFGEQLYWIYTEGKSLIMKLGPGVLRLIFPVLIVSSDVSAVFVFMTNMVRFVVIWVFNVWLYKMKFQS